MGKYFLAPGIYFCMVDDGTIFLDLNTHRYFALDSGSVQALSHFVSNWPSGSAGTSAESSSPAVAAETDIRDLVAALLDRHVLTESDESERAASREFTRPRDSYASTNYREPRPRLKVHHLVNFAWSSAYVALCLRLSHINPLIQAMRKYSGVGATYLRGSGDFETSARELVAVFRRLRLWTYSMKDACLFDSLALARFLHRYGIAPTFFIGVCTKPFASHAWVQLDDIVLNDSVENVLQYTPILVI